MMLSDSLYQIESAITPGAAIESRDMSCFLLLQFLLRCFFTNPTITAYCPLVLLRLTFG
jgi:hypothetical protein